MAQWLRGVSLVARHGAVITVTAPLWSPQYWGAAASRFGLCWTNWTPATISLVIVEDDRLISQVVARAARRLPGLPLRERPAFDGRGSCGTLESIASCSFDRYWPAWHIPNSRSW